MHALQRGLRVPGLGTQQQLHGEHRTRTRLELPHPLTHIGHPRHPLARPGLRSTSRPGRSERLQQTNPTEAAADFHAVSGRTAALGGREQTPTATGKRPLRDRDQVQDDIGALAVLGPHTAERRRQLLQRIGVKPQRSQRTLIRQRQHQLGTLDIPATCRRRCRGGGGLREIHDRRGHFSPRTEAGSVNVTGLMSRRERAERTSTSAKPGIANTASAAAGPSK